MLESKNMISWVRAMVFNATFNNISGISWRSILLVDETRVSEEKPATSHWDMHSLLLLKNSIYYQLFIHVHS